jgi:hypothetical protein
MLCWLVLILSAWNGLRLWTALAWRDVLAEFPPSPHPAIIAISGGAWLTAGIILVWSISRKKSWAARLLVWIAAGYSLWYWFERLFWKNPHPNWLFAVIVNLALLIFILFNARSLAREKNEQNNENRKID